jgi:hypothetical protein
MPGTLEPIADPYGGERFGLTLEATVELHIVPVLLGDSARLLDDLGGAEIELEQVRAVQAPGVTHLKYKVMTRGWP